MSGNSIYCKRQNHPELVARDLEELGVPKEVTREILKQRGINKWLTVRRLLIQLKDRWKGEVRRCQVLLSKGSLIRASVKHRQWVRGYLAACEDHRAQVRALCHADRDIDFPPCPNCWPIEAVLPGRFFRPGKHELRRTAQEETPR
jgi:hypothetical protein